MRTKLSYVREYAVFAMLGTIMFLSDLLMEFLPNIHLVGVLTVVYTLVFRRRALIPLYVYVVLTGLFYGFSLWWLPYLYIWTILWGVIMLLPKKLGRMGYVIYPLVTAIHGLLYGTLYAPAQALMFGLNFEGTIAWIIAGIPFDLIHSAGNLVLSLLIPPLVSLLLRLSTSIGILPAEPSAPAREEPAEQ